MSEPLVSVESVSREFVVKRSVIGVPLATVKAVDGVSFKLARGETLALVGESGCGKSTVGRLILGLIAPTSGRVVFEGQDLGRLSERELRRRRARMQLIFQDPYSSLNPRMTVGAMLAEPLQLHTDLSAGDRRLRVAELLQTVGLNPAHAERYPHEFSGGQRQRIAVARAIGPDPALIVCDEPVSALDVSIRSQVLNLLKDLQQRLGLTYLFISHDLAVVKHVADRVAVMYLGRIVETAAADALFAAPRHPYADALLSAIPLPEPNAARTSRPLPGDPPSPIAPPSGCHLHPRCPHQEEGCQTRVPALAAVGDDHEVACHRWQAIALTAGRRREAEVAPHVRRLMAAFARSGA